MEGEMPYQVKMATHNAGIFGPDGKLVLHVKFETEADHLCERLNAAFAAGAASAREDARLLARECELYRAKRKAKREESADSWRAAQEDHAQAMAATDAAGALGRNKA